MTISEQIADCFQNCREHGDSYRIEIDNSHALFILVQENPEYDDGRLEYFIELNKTSSGADEPCASYNASCDMDNFEEFNRVIVSYLGTYRIEV